MPVAQRIGSAGQGGVELPFSGSRAQGILQATLLVLISRLKLGFDPRTDSWGILKPGMKSEFVTEAQKEQALFPGHLKALVLAPQSKLVLGFPEKLAGVPESDHFVGDPYTLPFTWVYRVGKDRYRLEPKSGFGLILVVTDHPDQGMRLRAVFTYGS